MKSADVQLITMSSITNFNAFVVGLNTWLQDESDAAFFRWGCHCLAFAMPGTYPCTQVGLLQLLERPLKKWYPYDIPNKFDASFGLIEKGKLSYEANRYLQGLQAEDLPKGMPEQRSALRNRLFRELQEDLIRAYRSGEKVAQQEYVLLRRFLIENPFTTNKALRETFLSCKVLKLPKIGDLYEAISALESNSPVWKCDRCGPLTLEYEQLKGAKPSVCCDHRKSMDTVHEVLPEKGLRRLSQGPHLQVLIPGVPELELFSLLDGLCHEVQPGLNRVELYPEIDCYDLQLRFSDDTVWAVDVKDYPNPWNLKDELKPLYGAGALRYDEGLYVVPQAYLRQKPEYLIQAQSGIDMKGMQLMGTDAFGSKVRAKIKQLKREAKK